MNNLNWTKRTNQTIRTVHYLALILLFTHIFPVNAQEFDSTKPESYVELKAPDGSLSILSATADDDGDGIDNSLELNGYEYDIVNGITAWDGDTTKTYFITDPKRWSTDGDPYSDFMEVTGINMPSAISYPENHPLVAARPVITIKMTSYDVIPLATITNTQGGEQSSSFTNEVSTSNTVSASVTVGAELNPFKLASAEVTASYSHTWSNTQSTTSSFGSNWSNTRTTQPDQAAKLKLRVFMENIGGATALEVEPTINLKLGAKTIATFIPGQQANILTPPGTSDSRFPKSGDIVIEKDENNNDIVLSINELRAIQMGAPLSLEVIQVKAKVVRWNSDAQDWNSDIEWASFESEIDPVTVDIRAELGEGNNAHYQVFAGTAYWDPEFKFEDLVSLIFDFQENSNDVYIENRKYPDNWYLSSPSQVLLDEWNDAGRPQSLMGLKMNRNTKLVMLSPGNDPAPTVNLASYSADYKNVMISALPNNFPILEVIAKVPVDGEMVELALTQNDNSFYTSLSPLSGIAEGPGEVIVKNGRGDITTAVISLPSIYKDAADVKQYSSFLPDPGAEYWIYPNGEEDNPILLYCLFYDPDTHSELSVPREYLSIEQRNGMSVYSEYVAYTELFRFTFHKIRINPATYMVARDDKTFLSAENLSGGTDVPDYLYESVKIGNITWAYPEIDSAMAVINLTGSPLFFDVRNQLNNNPYTTAYFDKQRKSLTVKRTHLLDVSYEWYNFAGVTNDSLMLIPSYKAVPVAHALEDGGQALDLNATEDTGFISMGSSTALKMSSTMTLEARIYPTGPGLSETWGGMILNKEGEYEIIRNPNGTIDWAFSNTNPGWDWRSTNYMAPEKQWLQFALVYDSEWVRVYYNGELFQQYPVVGPVGDFHTDMNHFQLGGRQASTRERFQGFIDEVRVWNVARSAEQIRAFWNDTLTVEHYSTADSGLAGYWRMDSTEYIGDGVTITPDYSVNQNHGQIYGDVQLANLPTRLEGDQGLRPEQFSLEQNFPNPFNPLTTILFKLTKAGQVELRVYNNRGQSVKTLLNMHHNAGSYALAWDGRNDAGSQVASGLYFYRLFVDGIPSQTRKMILLR